MAYQYDIFISYRRDEFTRKWIEDYFVPKVRHFVFLETNIDPVFFVDDQAIEVGTTWPAILGNALGASKVIIPLWTKNYLKSVWCASEISQMMQRESSCGYRTQQNPYGLVFPTVIHDGETIPGSISIIQKIEIQKYFKPIAKDSLAAEEFHEKLVPLGKAVAEAIENAPPFNPQWQVNGAKQFFDIYYNSGASQQTKPPKLGNINE